MNQKAKLILLFSIATCMFACTKKTEINNYYAQPMAGSGGVADNTGIAGAAGEPSEGGMGGNAGEPVEDNPFILPPSCEDQGELQPLPANIQSCTDLGDDMIEAGEPLRWIINNYTILSDVRHASGALKTIGEDLDGMGSIETRTISRVNPAGEEIVCKPGSRAKGDFYDATLSEDDPLNTQSIDNSMLRYSNEIEDALYSVIVDFGGAIPGIERSMTSVVNYSVNHDFKNLFLYELRQYENLDQQIVCGQLKIYQIDIEDQNRAEIQTENQEVFESAEFPNIERRRIANNQNFRIREDKKIVDQPIALRTCENEVLSEAHLQSSKLPSTLLSDFFNNEFGPSFSGSLFSGSLFSPIKQARLKFKYNENEIRHGQVTGAIHLHKLANNLATIARYNNLVDSRLPYWINGSYLFNDIHLGSALFDPGIRAPLSVDTGQWLGPDELELPQFLLANAEPIAAEEYEPNCQIFFNVGWYPVMLKHAPYCTTPLGDSDTPSPDGENYNRELGEVLYPDLLFRYQEIFGNGDLFLQNIQPCEGLSVGYGISGVSANLEIIEE